LAGSAAAASETGRTKPRAWRRLAALLIDAALCSLVIGLFWPGDSTEIHIKNKTRHSAAATPTPPAAPVPPAPTTPESKESVSMGKDGFTVKSRDGDFHIGPDGMRVSGPQGKVDISKNGVKVDDKRKDVKVNVGLNGVEVDDPSDEENVYDEGGMTVSRIKRHKDWRFALVWLIYTLWFMKMLGTTVGGKICKLAVVPMSGTGPLEKRQRLMRALFSLVSGYCLLLGYLWALWEKDGRGWHDLIAGTRVVDAP